MTLPFDDSSSSGTALPASYLANFSEQEGYLNHASYGPPSADVIENVSAGLALAASGAVGASESLHREDIRARAAFARLSGFSFDATMLVPGTSYGLFQLAFGIKGGRVLVSRGEFPANTYPWLRASQAGLISLSLMGGASTPVTAQLVSENLTPEITAIAVSAVDFRTGYRADLAAIREAIGPDRLLLVDAIQGFGVIEEDWSVADAIVVGSQKWIRGGWGAGAVSFSPAGLERIAPVIGGWTGVEAPSLFSLYDDGFHEPRTDALKFGVTNLSPFATGGFASALELIEEAGLAAVATAVSAQATYLAGVLENVGIDVLSPADPLRRAGIVVAGFPEGNAAEAHKALSLEGFVTTLHGKDRIRFAPHATTPRDAMNHAGLLLAPFA